MQNTLYYGDNLPILRQYIASESVDLVYLDPPFNSNRSYNVLFREEKGNEVCVNRRSRLSSFALRINRRAGVSADGLVRCVDKPRYNENEGRCDGSVVIAQTKTRPGS